MYIYMAAVQMANGAELPQQLIISNNVNENKEFHKV